MMWKQIRILASRFGIRPSKYVVRTDDERVEVRWPYRVDSHRFRWDEVEEIVTFKRDLGTVDDIRLRFQTPDRVYEISEGDDGFEALVEIMRQEFPSIPEDWYGNVMHPAFATNLTTLWRRGEAPRQTPAD